MLELLEALLEREPDVEPLATLAAMLTRRAGKLEEAYAMAVATWARFPSWRAAVAWANAARAVGRWDDAVRAWTEALRIDPEDLSVRLDWGDALLDRGELVAARERYAEVLEREPDHAWAAPSVLYVDWLRFPTASTRLALAGWAAAHPDHPRAVDLGEGVTPWVGRLPEPLEDEDDVPDGIVTAVLSRVARVVAAVASRPFHAGDWTEAGAELARAEGVGTDDATDLWQVAVTPTVLPVDPRYEAWGWRTTHAAAFVLAALPGWDDTAHRMAMLDLLEQPRSAPVVAAMAALAERGRGDPALRADVRDRLVAALDDPRGEVAWAAACALHRMRLDAEPALTRAVLQTLSAFEDPQPEA
ncbi:MAG: tetratricopeptide repeat protein [Alphaproteobacteria bacterium]|nr:tetratricopeptide repeat protein [Alphaproteobacteria bacterium]